MATINIGRVRPNWMGEYSIYTTYAILDAVSYNGSSYIMYALATAGTPPTTTAKWFKLAAKGDTGAQGIQGVAFDPTFETVSANLSAYPVTLVYDINGKLESATYDIGGGDSIVKTFGFSGGKLTTITLSGDTPNGIDLVKTFSYTLGKLTGIDYS